MPSLRALTLVLLALPAVALSTPAATQKLARKAFQDEEHGYQFKPPEDFNPVPPQPQEAELGVVVKLSGKDLPVRKGTETYNLSTEAAVLRFAERTVRAEGKEGETAAESKVRDDVGVYLEQNYKALDKDKPQVDKQVKINKLEARHRTWSAQTAQLAIPLLIDAWSFRLTDADVHLIYVVADEHSKKWMKVFEKSAETFRLIDRSEGTAALTKGASYEELLAYHKEDAEKIPGWTALPTPSKKFILKTSSDNKKLVNDVIQRLEKSRVLYEEDFPPSKDFGHVSIVRLCATEDEFHTYGRTGGGVAGWFNPGTTELVLYNAQAVDPNMSLAVMSHEAFHQYCHFLFGQSEAHRWFDEGHGDYYGAFDFKGSKAIVTVHMPGGLDRYGVIKTMVQEKSYKPIAEHINFDHQEWQNQDPTNNVACYSQSWSIIYMLRQGTLGNVPKKVWKPEYADIIPKYVETLHAGFSAAYAEILAERAEVAQREGRELTDEERQVSRIHLEPGAKEEIWKQAMEASWGQVDLDEFEANWVAFVEDVL